MAPVSYASRRVDDDDLYDDDGNGPYDKNYPGQRVIADRGHVHVPIYMTDGMPPEWMRSLRPAPSDPLRHRPHQLVSDSAELRDAEREAARAYDERNDFLRDAWRGSSAPPPLAVRNGESARDAWIRQLGEAWRASPDLPARDPEDDDDPKAAATAVETQRRRWNAESPTKDAALTDRDASYGEYIQRLTTAWMRPYGTIR
jgi:hypothetical protein